MKDEKYIATDPRFSAKWENFWYHYKWHTIVSLFLVFVLLFLGLQTCQKQEYGYFMMYAGPKSLSTAETVKMADYLEKVAEESGLEPGKQASFSYLYINLDKDSGTGGLTSQNLQVFDDDIMTGKSTLLLISPALYARLIESDGGIIALDEYLPKTDHSIRFADDTHRGILLSSLGLYQQEGFSSLPADTVLCLRSPVSLGNLFRPEKAQKEFQNYETLFRALLAIPFIPAEAE